jgi:hypothetical protein
MGVKRVDGNISVSSPLYDSFCADEEIARGGGEGEAEDEEAD